MTATAWCCAGGFLLAFVLGFASRSLLRRWRRSRTLVPFDALRALYRPRRAHGGEGRDGAEQVVRLFRSEEDLDRTLELLEGWADEDPEDTSLRLVLAFAHYKAGDDERALTHVEALLPLSGHNPYLHYLHGLVEQRRGNVEIAMRAWEEVIRLRPDHKITLDAQRRLDSLEDRLPPEPA